MKVNMEKIEKNTVALDITIDAAKFQEGVEDAYRKLSKKVNIPGFRKGKAPKAMIINQIGKEYLYDEALETLLPEIYYDAVKETGIEPIDRPNVDVKEKLEEGKDVLITIKVDVKPEVKLGQYKELEVEKPSTKIEDADLEKELENMRLRNAQLIPIEDGAIEKGDIAQINFEGFSDGEPFPGGAGTDYPLEIGSGSFIPGFEEQLIGAKVGDNVDVNVTFPEDYHATELAGKPVVFKVTINSAKRKEIAALDDEFAKDVSEFETLEELKKDILNKLEQAAEKRAEQTVRKEVIDKASEKAEVEVPQVMVEQRIDSMIDNMDQRLKMQGLSLEDYLKYSSMTIEQVREQYKEEAERSVKVDLVLESIAKAENIQVSDEDVENQIEKMAEQYHQEKESIRNMLQAQGNLDMIRENLAIEKTIDFLIEQAKIA